MGEDPVAADGSVNYCGTVDAKSPFPPTAATKPTSWKRESSGGRVSSAVVGLIVGGKDIEIVRKMCKKYDLDPNDAS